MGARHDAGPHLSGTGGDKALPPPTRYSWGLGSVMAMEAAARTQRHAPSTLGSGDLNLRVTADTRPSSGGICGTSPFGK